MYTLESKKRTLIYSRPVRNFLELFMPSKKQLVSLVLNDTLLFYHIFSLMYILSTKIKAALREQHA